MGAREDLLEAARELTRRGAVPFSPAELIAQARTRGSNYPDSTLRTFIVAVMCVNAPDNHAVKYGDLRRVGRGLYQLEGEESSALITARPAAVAPEAPPVPAASDIRQDATTEWWWEGNVQAAVVRHLAAEGWSIRRVADTSSREHGVDIDASRGAERLLVEVKGYPSATYVRGPKEGTAKAGGVAMQARTYYAGAVLSGMLMRSERPDARVLLVLPDVETYRSLTARTCGPLDRTGVELWLVDQAGTISQISDHTE